MRRIRRVQPSRSAQTDSNFESGTILAIMFLRKRHADKTNFLQAPGKQTAPNTRTIWQSDAEQPPDKSRLSNAHKAKLQIQRPQR